MIDVIHEVQVHVHHMENHDVADLSVIVLQFLNHQELREQNTLPLSPDS